MTTPASTLINDVLHAVATDVCRNGPNAWTAALANGLTFELHVSLALPWLQLRVSSVQLRALRPDADVLRAASGLAGAARVARPLRCPGVQLRADVFLDDVDVEVRLATACRDLADAGHAVLHPEAAERAVPVVASDLPPDLVRLFEDTGWASTLTRDGRRVVALPVSVGTVAATVETPDGSAVRLQAVVDDLSDLQADGLEAAAVVALALADRVSGVATGWRDSDGALEMSLAAAISPLTTSGVDRAASALAVACRMYRGLSHALRDAATCAHYLSLHEPALRRHPSVTTEVTPCVQQQ